MNTMKIRVKFSKHGCMKFIGHLDVMRYFQKVIRRAGIDIAYSEGYSPHQKISFAQPLSVGAESNGEYFDMELKSAVSSDDLISRMNATQAEGILVEDAVLLPEKSENAMASVAAADYTVRFREGYECPFDLAEAISDFNAADTCMITKETKRSTRELDLKEFVYDLHTTADGLFMRLSAGSGTNIKPALLLSDMYAKRGFELPQFALMITREEIYSDDKKPLIAAGEHFSGYSGIGEEETH